MPSPGVIRFQVTAADVDKRLDILLASSLSDCSRNRAADLIRQGSVLVSGTVRKPGYAVKIGDVVQCEIPPPEPSALHPEAIDFQVLFEDPAFAVVDKPAGLVVHPAPGHENGTMVHGLLHRFPDMEGIGGEMRPGIVHRLDKDTSGVLVVAKNQAAHQQLSVQFKNRSVDKQYIGIVYGVFDRLEGMIDLPIGRHPADRKKMSVLTHRPRNAETRWRVRESYGDISLLDLKILTGRTHQIRVHCAAIQHPLVGDPVYGPRKGRLLIKNPLMAALIAPIQRQMLHAFRVELDHPVNGKRLCFEAPIPRDMGSLIQALRDMAGSSGGRFQS
ncbi:MAG: RluA family pseudouridine synthase [Thermodesulfobacteriota bacterium]